MSLQENLWLGAWLTDDLQLLQLWIHCGTYAKVMLPKGCSQSLSMAGVLELSHFCSIWNSFNGTLCWGTPHWLGQGFLRMTLYSESLPASCSEGFPHLLLFSSLYFSQALSPPDKFLICLILFGHLIFGRSELTQVVLRVELWSNNSDYVPPTPKIHGDSFFF